MWYVGTSARGARPRDAVRAAVPRKAKGSSMPFKAGANPANPTASAAPPSILADIQREGDPGRRPADLLVSFRQTRRLLWFLDVQKPAQNH